MSYVPSPDHAYESVLYIDQTPFGALVRGIHHWAAGLLVLMIGLHTLRVFIWGAHRYPREITWLVGAGLFFVVLGFAFTGYLLPWDQKAYWATVVGTNIAGSAPLIGGAVLEFLRGGVQLGAVTLARFYGIHVWVLPAALLVLVGIHLFAVIRQGIAASPRRTAARRAREPGSSRREAYEREYAAEKEAGKPFWEALAQGRHRRGRSSCAVVCRPGHDPGRAARSPGRSRTRPTTSRDRSGTSSTSSSCSGTSPAASSRS